MRGRPRTFAEDDDGTPAELGQKPCPKTEATTEAGPRKRGLAREERTVQRAVPGAPCCKRAVAMPAHYALPIVASKARESATERPSGSALNPLEPLDLNSSLRQAALPAVGPISTNSISSVGL